MRANTIPVSDGGAPERAIAVAGVLPGEEAGVEDSLKELKELLRTASAEVVGEVVQRIPHRGQPAYLGKGKLEELAALAAALRADFVAFDDDLKPSQARNIEKVVKVRVLDRTEVILSIFAMHARTNEAKAQVELAQLEYSAPRLRHRWSHLWRQTAGYAIGTRGPGEKQLEVDRRALRKRMTDLKRELAEIRAHRNRIVS
ncbi:MAG: GTPase HflX, partial [Planctomycetota bacterium]